MRREWGSDEQDLRFAPVEPCNGQTDRAANRSANFLHDLGEFASRHGRSIDCGDEVTAMDTGFGGGRIFNYMHDRQNAPVVRLRLGEDLASYDSNHAAVICCGPQRRGGNQKREEDGQRSEETTNYLGRKHTDCDRTKIAISKQKPTRPGSVCILALDNEMCFGCWL